MIYLNLYMNIHLNVKILIINILFCISIMYQSYYIVTLLLIITINNGIIEKYHMRKSKCNYNLQLTIYKRLKTAMF